MSSSGNDPKPKRKATLKSPPPSADSKQSPSNSASSSSSPPFQVCPQTGRKVYLVSITSKEYKSILCGDSYGRQNNNKQQQQQQQQNQQNQQRQRHHLFRVQPKQDREEIYRRLAKTMGQQEEATLPKHGGRKWTCRVRLIETLSFSKQKTPLFALIQKRHYATENGNTNRRMDLAAAPYYLNPPNKRHHIEQWLADMAWNNPHHCLPRVHRVWISPNQRPFHTREAAHAHAKTLEQQDRLLSHVLEGKDCTNSTHRFPPMQFTDEYIGRVVKLRMERDGIWVVGQDESWQQERGKLIEQARLRELRQEERKRKRQGGWKRLVKLCNQRPETVPDMEEKEEQEIGETATRKNDKTEHGSVGRGGLKRRRSVRRERKEPDIIDLAEIDNEDGDDDEGSDLEEDSQAEMDYSRNEDGVPEDETSAETPISTASSRVEGFEKVGGAETVIDHPPPPKHPSSKRQSGRSHNAKAHQKSKARSGAGGDVVKKLSFAFGQKEQDQRSTAGTKKRTRPTTRRWCLDESMVEKLYDISIEQYEDVMGRIERNGIELDRDFDLIRRRGEKRYDLEWPSNQDFQETSGRWKGLVEEILGPKVTLTRSGVYYVEPGAPAEKSFSLLAPHLTLKWQRPCHAIQVLVPMVDLDKMHQLLVGSHILYHDDADHPENSIVSPSVPAGTPILVDSRLGQRGLANKTDEPVLIWYYNYVADHALDAFRRSLGENKVKKLVECIEVKEKQQQQHRQEAEEEKKKAEEEQKKKVEELERQKKAKEERRKKAKEKQRKQDAKEREMYRRAEEDLYEADHRFFASAELDETEDDDSVLVVSPPHERGEDWNERKLAPVSRRSASVDRRNRMVNELPERKASPMPKVARKSTSYMFGKWGMSAGVPPSRSRGMGPLTPTKFAPPHEVARLAGPGLEIGTMGALMALARPGDESGSSSFSG